MQFEIDTANAIAFIVSISEEGKALPRPSIPQRYRAGLAALAALPESAFADFIDWVEKGVSADTPAALAERLENELPAFHGDPESVKILSAAESIQGVYKNSHVSLQTFASEIAEALLDDAPTLKKEIDPRLLSERIKKTVKAPTIEITTEKIKELQTEVERGFCSARILTDARVSFAHDPSVAPAAMTIMHTLRIRYHDDSARHREFYVSLDMEDLASLKEAIERAQTKSKTLEALLAKADCRLFE